MADTIKESTGFPLLSRDTLSPSGYLPSYPNQHESYYQYLRKIESTFSDLEQIKSHMMIPDNDPQLTAAYALDIGEFTEASQNLSIRGQGPVKGPKAIDELLHTAAAGTRLRILFCYHRRSKTDPAIFENVTSFYDINPRIVQEHHLRSLFNDGSINRLPAQDACPAYLPSEAHFSPIQFERAIWTRQKKMTALLVSNPAATFKTVLIFVSRETEFYSKNIVNRDILNPTVYLPSESLGHWRQPQNEAETCFLRLSRQSSLELEACVSQPILAILPLVRGYCLETSQDIFQLRNHINYYGLGDASQDKAYVINSSPENHWGHQNMDPFKAFQKVNASFTTTYRSLYDHLSSPWLDRTKPHMEIADAAISIAMIDAKRVQDEVMELREVLKETSALVSAQESIYEARRSVAQAESVNQLTRLAFIFIPLTFATSVFGMNINEWQDNVPHLKWFFIIALCCTSFTILSALLLAKLAPIFRAWTTEHKGFGNACWHFVRDHSLAVLLFFFITLPTKIRDFSNPELRRIRREQKRKAKANMV